jgi:hypothetical protein
VESPSTINPLELDKFNTSAGVRMSMVMTSDFSSIFNVIDFAPLNAVLTSKFDEVKSFFIQGKKQTYYVFPIIFEETPATLEEFSNQETYNELAAKILENNQFKAMFEKTLPIADILTYLTIYVIENFIESINRDSAQAWSAFKLWNGDVLEMSKKYLKSTTQQFYYGRTSESIDQISAEINPDKKVGAGMSEGVAKAALDKLQLTKKQKRSLRPKPSDIE